MGEEGLGTWLLGWICSSDITVSAGKQKQNLIAPLGAEFPKKGHIWLKMLPYAH
jgi:hypothetical protein